MSKEIISLIIFLCIVIILIMNYFYLHKYSELKIPILVLIATLLFRFYNIFCMYKQYDNNIKTEIIFELILLIIMFFILYKYAVVKKYISL